jgi:cutinase
VEVVFARGSTEPPGVGLVGQSFVDSLRAQLGPRSVDVYPVTYPASGDFANSGFSSQVLQGVSDAGTHVRNTAAACPNTRIVLGGYSQGAMVAAFVAAAEPAAGVKASTVADHVAAVTLFGKPSGAFVGKYNAPDLALGPQYVAQTIDLCIPGDTVCDGNPGGGTNAAHNLYAANGMTAQAAEFAADRIGPAAAPAA